MSIPRLLRVASGLDSSDRDAIYAARAAPDFDPRRVAHVSTPVEVVTNQAVEPVSIAASQPDQLVVEASLTTPGLLVMSEVNYPGWTATVNGRPAPIVEVDGLLRGVALPSGLARVETIFRPASLTAGGVLTALGIMLWMAFIVWPVRRNEVNLGGH